MKRIIILTVAVASIFGVFQGVSGLAKKSALEACHIAQQSDLVGTNSETRQKILDLATRAATLNPSYKDLQHDISSGLFGRGYWNKTRTDAIDRVYAKCAEIGVRPESKAQKPTTKEDKFGNIVDINSGQCIMIRDHITGEYKSVTDQSRCPGAGSGSSAIPDPNITALPNNVDPDSFGLRIGSAWKSKDSISAPEVQIWFDFQCPPCANLENSSGEKLLEMAKNGQIRLELRPTTFLDDSLKSQNLEAGNLYSSAKATNALGCAANSGNEAEFYKEMFAEQPKTEGSGFSDESIMHAINKLDLSEAQQQNMKSCVADNTFANWAKKSTEAFFEAKLTSIPAGFLNDKKIAESTLLSTSGLLRAILTASN